jgi:hypothetical protein
VIVSAACSFNTDGITFKPDSEFNAGAAGRTPGAGSGPIGDAGDQGDAGDVSVAGNGSGGAAHGGSGNAGKGSGGSPSAGSAGVAAGGTGGIVGTGGVVSGGFGGVVNVAGSIGAGGGPSGKTYPCKGMKPGEKLLADFENVSTPMDQWQDGNGTIFGAYAFPDPANGHPKFDIKGALSVQATMVNMPTGGGIRMAPCIDLTGAVGIAFDVTAYYPGPSAPNMAVRIITNQSIVADDTTREGTCLPKPGQDPQQYCNPPHADFVLKGMSTVTVPLKFGDFTGGQPSDTPDLDQVKRIEWVLTTLSAQKPYDASFTIDNIYVLY